MNMNCLSIDDPFFTFLLNKKGFTGCHTKYIKLKKSTNTKPTGNTVF